MLLKCCCCFCQGYIGLSSSRNARRNSSQNSIALTHMIREIQQQTEQQTQSGAALARQRDLDDTGTTPNTPDLPPMAIIHQPSTVYLPRREYAPIMSPLLQSLRRDPPVAQPRLELPLRPYNPSRLHLLPNQWYSSQSLRAESSTATTSYDMGPALEEGEDEALRRIRAMGGAAPTYEEATASNNVPVTAQV